MRSGLLAVGVILLVLGAIFYFVPTPASTQDESVTTTTYAGLGNDTNSTNSTTTSDTTTSTRTTTSDSAYADRQDVNDAGVPVVYVYLDDNGDMYSEDGAFLGEGISSADMNTRVGDRYGTAANNYQVQNTADQAPAGAQADTQNTADTTTSYGTTGDANSDRVNTADNGQVTQSAAGDGFNDPDTFGDAEDDGLNAGAVNTADTSASSGGWLRTLSILAMVLGAILTILGLVLPSSDYVDARARTTSPGRRVRYEREEEHHHVRK